MTLLTGNGERGGWATDYFGSNTSSLGRVLLVSLLRMFPPVLVESVPLCRAVVDDDDVGSGEPCLDRVVGAIASGAVAFRSRYVSLSSLRL